MTERLYYRDAYLQAFEAGVVGVHALDGRTGVELDRTAFYPASGGQPFDTGTLGQVRVVEVLEREDGSILHVIDGTAPSGRVEGRIRWERRFEHMQQHTGQHILSAAFDRLLGVRTASFHLGSAASTIDLEGEVTAAGIAEVEEAANQVVWEDRPVTVSFVEAADAAALPLRKQTARSGPLRIVEVEGFDVSACGGTHVARTGAIGIIAITASERFRGGSRVEFRCGVRALRSHRALRDAVAGCVQLISAGADELPQAIERLQTENREARRRARDLETRLAVYRGDALAAAAMDFAGVRVAIQAVEDIDAGGLKGLAQAIASRPGHAAILLTTTTPVAVVVARAVDADEAFDAAAILKQLLTRFGGRGGGRPELAQGGGLDGTPDQILIAARALTPGAGGPDGSMGA